MINNLIGIGAMILGATMAKKAGVTFFESSAYSDFEITDRIVDSIRVFESGTKIFENAYWISGEYLKPNYPNSKRYTIGNGMTYLFLGDGKPFVTNYPAKGLNAVRSGDNLSSLKVVMGYANLSNADFSKQLTVNYSKVPYLSFYKVAKDFDRLGIPYRENYAEALMEMSYGSQSAFQSKSGAYSIFLTSVKNDPSPYNFARSYFNYRYSYYKSLGGAWDYAKYGWMPRVFYAAMVAKGSSVDAMTVKNKYAHNASRNLQNKSLLIDDIKREFGVTAIW
ncbi:hypothetical protein CMU25_18770 [Elizabethkingia anophelis]|nr:hypothetical protein [Elizabethkingia anophelis]MDV3842362.1 hypothetical protein [Elizabethkingia anophelis]